MKLECKVNCLNVDPITVLSFGLIMVLNSKRVIHTLITNDSMYIHGGRDLKEGAISTMWRVNITAIQ